MRYNHNYAGRNDSAQAALSALETSNLGSTSCTVVEMTQNTGGDRRPENGGTYAPLLFDLLDKIVIRFSTLPCRSRSHVSTFPFE